VLACSVVSAVVYEPVAVDALVVAAAELVAARDVDVDALVVECAAVVVMSAVASVADVDASADVVLALLVVDVELEAANEEAVRAAARSVSDAETEDADEVALPEE